jgi:hypothetical protein
MQMLKVPKPSNNEQVIHVKCLTILIVTIIPLSSVHCA